MSAASEGDQEVAPSPQAALERPIHTPVEDKLERGAFIGRLCDAVIARGSKKATGVIIGVCCSDAALCLNFQGERHTCSHVFSCVNQ